MNKQESQNQVSIIINGVRYDAVDIPTDFPYHPCAYCGVMEDCTLICDTTFCGIFELEDKWFKKSDKKFEK